MKVQLKDIILAVPALSKLSAGDLQLRLAYKLKRMISALQKEADFFAEQRQKIFEKYGPVICRTVPMIFRRRTSRKPPPNWMSC